MSEPPSTDPRPPGSPAAPVSSNDVTSPPPQVNEISRWRYLLLLPLAAFVRVWIATLRFRIAEKELSEITYAAGPAVNILWHNRLFIVGEIIRRYRCRRPMVVLVSPSRDGAWLTAFFKLMGVRVARGSSSRRGMRALLELLGEAKGGRDIGVTPDGPRGPCYEIKPGALLLARHAGLPILLISARYHSAWRLRSWDGFFVPKPFSIVEMRSRLLPGYASLGVDNDKDAAQRLHECMMELTADG